MTGQRIEVPTWDETFINIAQVVAKRSKDPKKQVGACIVSNDNRVLSVGYNGTPHGFDDESFPWISDSDDILETKHPYVVHAERNAILNFRGILREFSDAKLYTTYFPCNECAKEIVQSGINEVIYLDFYSGNDRLAPASSVIFKKANVSIRKFVE